MQQPFLQLRTADGEVVRDIPLSGGRLVIGRSPRVDVTLDGAHVSRQHAELTCDASGTWWVRDLGSVNGTIVNGVVLARPQALALGDRIEIEGMVLLYRV